MESVYRLSFGELDTGGAGSLTFFLTVRTGVRVHTSQVFYTGPSHYLLYSSLGI